MKPEFKILTSTAILGYGFPKQSFEEGMKRNPDLIAVDGGSTDPGPYYLGSGVSFTDRNAVKRDLEIMIVAGIEKKIPVVVGTAGGAGANSHLKWCEEIVLEIAKEKGLSFKLATISSQVSKDFLLQELKAGKISPLDAVPTLTEEELTATTNVVAQMGIEPMIKALAEEADIILAGRAYDPTCFAALPIMKGYDPGLSLHLAKILECAAICATPGSGSDCMFGYIGEDYFRVEPLSPIRKCTTVSVAAHTLYEKTNPYILPGPGGHLDLTSCEFIQETDAIVRVKGTKFIPSEEYKVKLEGAKLVGYRTVSIAGARDPIMLQQIDEIIEAVKKRVADNFTDMTSKYHLTFNIYGRNGVMAALEPVKNSTSHELGIVIEAIAENQEVADTICAFARSTMLHYGYEGRRSTAGNLAFPYSPSDFHAGAVYAFSIYHLLETADPTSLFKINYSQVGSE